MMTKQMSRRKALCEYGYMMPIVSELLMMMWTYLEKSYIIHTVLQKDVFVMRQDG